MAANTGTIHGGDILLSYNSGTVLSPVWTPFAHGTTHSIKHPTSMREIASRTSGKHTNVRPGKHGITVISASGIATYDGADYFTLKDLRDNMTAVQVKLSGRPSADTAYIEVKEQTGDKYETGTGYISSLQRDDPHDNNSTYSVEISVDGATTIATVSA